MIRKLTLLILLLHSDTSWGRYSVFKYKICANIDTVCCSAWYQPTAIIKRALSSHRQFC